MFSALWMLPTTTAPSSDNWIAYKGFDGVVRLKVLQ
jgi:hypothetical protein